jgi:hypothetical protein
VHRRAWVPTGVLVAWAMLGCGTAAAQTGWTPPRGVQLPAPWGLGLALYAQDQDYDIGSLSVGIPGFDPALAAGLEVENETRSYHLRADRWVVPFLNVFLLLGQVDGKTDVALSGLDLGVPLTDLRIDYDGWMYGGGVSIAGGWDRYFAVVTANYTKTDLDLTDSKVKAWVVTPKLGMHFDRTAVWIGAMYQDAQEEHRGQVEIPFFGTVPFQVLLEEKEPWNLQAGFTTGLGRNGDWNLTVEGGFGDRTSVLVQLERRFGR